MSSSAPGWVTAVCMVLYVLIITGDIARPYQNRLFRPRPRGIFAWSVLVLLDLLLIAAILVGVFSGSLIGLDRLLGFAAKTITFLHSPLKVTVLVFVLALLLFIFSKRSSFYYGLCEISFGLVAASIASSKIIENDNSPDGWIALIGSTYLVVRGLTNVSLFKAMTFRQMLKKIAEFWRAGSETHPL